VLMRLDGLFGLAGGLGLSWAIPLPPSPTTFPKETTGTASHKAVDLSRRRAEAIVKSRALDVLVTCSGHQHMNHCVARHSQQSLEWGCAACIALLVASMASSLTRQATRHCPIRRCGSHVGLKPGAKQLGS